MFILLSSSLRASSVAIHRSLSLWSAANFEQDYRRLLDEARRELESSKQTKAQLAETKAELAKMAMAQAYVATQDSRRSSWSKLCGAWRDRLGTGMRFMSEMRCFYLAKKTLAVNKYLHQRINLKIHII